MSTVVSLVSAAVVKRDSPVHLAVSPNCTELGGSVADLNVGLPPLSTFKTIVAFGDQYSDNGVQNGSTPAPPVLTPPNPDAGGRPSNGPVWTEVLARNVGATLKGYAAPGAVADFSQYPAIKISSDLTGQVSLFISQVTRYDPSTTLYTVFFGINDFALGGNLDLAAQNIVYNILVLSSSPIFARNILIVDNYGRGTKTPAGEAYKQAIFSSLPALRKLGLNVGFVDLSNVWDGVFGSNPGYEAFGYTNPGALLDQIEQMEQLITLKLQNIDANFANIHHLLANKVLPALKRYAVATEPVREAAKFWTSFYEQAAQIKIPTFDDHSTVNEESQQPEMISTMQDQTTDTSPPLRESHPTEPSMTSTNVSFMPGQDAFSSTPATARMTRMHETSSETTDESSWNVSLDPSMIRKSQFSQQTSAVEDETILEHARAEQGPLMHIDEPTPIPTRREIQLQPRNEKGKARDTTEPLLRNVLRHNLYPTDTSSAKASSAVTSPLKYRGKPKTPVPKKYNPFLSADKDPSQWDGIVDLTDPSATPQRFRRDKPTSLYRTSSQEIDDDSFDGLPPGMSPPVMMSPARPPRSMAELGLLRLGQTPIRDASARITRDLVRDVQYRNGTAARDGYLHSRIESTMSTVPTPPSLSRYRQHDTSDSIVIDSSLESMMRRVGLSVPSSVGATGSTPALRLRSHASLKASESISNDSATLPPVVHEEHITPVHRHEDLSDSDSMDEINNTAHPSQAFLMASAGARDDSDDSFGSNHSSDSLEDEGADPDLAPIHPFAGSVEDDAFDDSFDDEMYDRLHGEVEEETLFGVPPQQRMQAQQRSNGGLRMLGDDLLQDTIGIGSQIGRIEESPTPGSRQ
ncbi:hypothetical protein C0995_001742 [Termitomyces sp. Mi166|nr:hypothetical protein C0995_001742 [Termitomyces sp. Mi166\